MSIKQIITTSMLAASGLLLTTGNGYAASAYAVSYSNISNFGVTTSSGSVSISGFSFSNSTAVNDTGDSATGVDFAVSSSDAAASCIGDCTSLNNSFSSHSTLGLADFIYADAQVGSTDINGGNGSASAIAEANITSGMAFATGSNNLSGGQLSIGAGGATFSFDFWLDSYLEVSGDAIGTAWSSINLMINNTSTSGFPKSFTIGSGSVGTVDAFDSYVSSDFYSLDEGVYSLSIAMDNSVNLTTVPVPAAVWLFGTGLVALAGIARRKQS